MQLTWCHRSFLSISSHTAFRLLFGCHSLPCRVVVITRPIQTVVGLLGFYPGCREPDLPEKKKKAIFHYKI